MNKIFLTGNLTRDPELTETANGIKLCRFSIAVNRSYGGADGERKTDFFNCVAWRGLGETVAKYAKKGNKVAVVGSVELHSYEDNDGVKRTNADVAVREVEFLTPKPSADGGEKFPEQSSDDDSDIPF